LNRVVSQRASGSICTLTGVRSLTILNIVLYKVSLGDVVND